MPSSKSTIFFLAALAVVGPVAMTQPANALQAMGPPPVRRAEHIQLAHKMVKKRSPTPRVVPIRRQGQENTPEPGDGAATEPTPSPSGIDLFPSSPKPSNTVSTTPAANSPPPTTTPRVTSTSSSTASTSNTAIQSSSSSVSARSSTTSTSASSSSTQQSLVTSSTPIASSATLQDTVIQPSSTQSTGRPSTVLVTTTSTAGSAPQQSDKSKDQDASFLPKGVIVGLIVAAACVVGAAAIWTIIRKWKFGASRRFEDRLEPVNWEPPATSGLPMDERDPTAVAIARGNSVNSQRARTSFGSSEGTHLGGPAGGSVAPDFPPAHDFTAGPLHLAAGAGYADLQRGPSPAPSMNYSAYGQQYSTPNPYDAYDYNSGYAAYAGGQQPPHNGGPGPHQF